MSICDEWKDWTWDKGMAREKDYKKYDFCSCGISLCYRPKKSEEGAYYKFKRKQ